MKLFFLGVAILLCLVLISPASAWLTGYAYRQAHNLTGDPSWAGDQTNYQVMLTVNNTTGTSTGGTIYLNDHAMQWGSATTWADIRVTDSADNLLPIWFENTSATTTSVPVWLNVSTIAKTGNTSIYVYYGNSTAITADNGYTTFWFFDHFDGGSTVNTSLWTTSGTINQGSSVIDIYSSASSHSYISGKVSGGGAIRARIKTAHSGVISFCQEFIRWSSPAPTSYGFNLFYTYGDSSVGGKYRNTDPSGNNYTNILGHQSGTWYIQDILEKSDRSSFFLNGGNNVEITKNFIYLSNMSLFLDAYGVAGTAGHIYGDWILGRKYISPEPTHSTWGAEEGVPVANFTANVTSGTAPLTIAFTDSSTYAPTSWAWSFDDGGANSTDQNPVRTFTNPGLYTIILTATNLAGSDTEEKVDYINVTAASPSPPVADFSANVTTGYAPLCVQFSDESTNSPTSWAWSWDDGTANMTTQNPIHCFTDPGLYTIALTATNAGGSGSEEKIDYIEVIEPTPTPTPTPTLKPPEVPGTSVSGKLSPLTFSVLMMLSIGAMVYGWIGSQDSNYGGILGMGIAFILFMLLSVLMVGGGVATVDYPVSTTNETNNTTVYTYAAAVMPYHDTALGYFLAFLGVLCMIYTALLTIEYIRLRTIEKDKVTRERY